MFDSASLLDSLDSLAVEIHNSAKLIEMLGGSLARMTKRELLNYRGRFGKDGPLFHEVFISRGVYAVEIPRGVWIGSTESGDECMGLRWRRYCQRPFGNPIYRMVSESLPDACIFHALAITSCESETRYLENGMRAFAEKRAPHLLLNAGKPADFRAPFAASVRLRIAEARKNPQKFPLRVS